MSFIPVRFARSSVGRWISFTAVLAVLVLAAGPRPGHAQPARPGQTTGGDRYTVLHIGTLLAVPGQAPRQRVSVIIKNDRIERIESGFSDAETLAQKEGDQVSVIDLKDRFVLPGLMDAHVHLSHQPTLRRRRAGRAGDMPADYAVNAVIYARRGLAAGFTTVRDLGSDDQSVFAVRDAINAGRLIGPRILAAGSAISVTGGHADPTTIRASEAERLRLGVCDSPSECRRAVRTQHKLGADVIKFMSTGGFASQTGLNQQMFLDEMKAIVETGHQLGLKITTHAYDPEAIKDAIRAGVDSVEHGFLLDDEGIKMMKARGVWFVPTLSASMPPPIFGIKNAPSVALRNEYKAFERAYRAGVKIAFGSDVGTFSHGQSAKEFDLMVKFGMTPADALIAATIHTAELFGLEDEIGTVTPGKLADIIAVAGDPLQDISVLHHVDFVMKSGKIAKQNGVMQDGISYPPFRE